jgi:hypothetical protein
LGREGEGENICLRKDQVGVGCADNEDMPSGSSFMRWDAPAPVRRDDATGSQGAPRRGTASDAEIVLPGRGLQYPGQIAELSVAGCVIETKCKLEAGTAVEVWMRTEGMPLRLAARLVERGERGVQFEFQPMPLRKQEQLEVLKMELERDGQPGTGTNV